MGGKQADRNAKKQNMKKEEQEEASSEGRPSGGRFAEQAKDLVMSSVLVEHGPKVPEFAKVAIELIKSGQTTEKKQDESSKESSKENEDNSKVAEDEPAAKNEKDEADATKGSVPDRVLDKDACGTFTRIQSRLTLFNPLGLFASSDKALAAWKAMAPDMDRVDFGPKAKRKGTPKLDRIVTNFDQNLVQYIYILFAWMILRAFLFRSFFACLPWLMLYQFLSADLPLGPTTYRGIPLDKVPMEKVPVELRVVITIALHGLVCLFFLYELVVKTYWLELILVGGLIAYHAFAVRPVEA